MLRKASDHLTFGPKVLKLLDYEVNELILKHHPTPDMIGEFPTIVGLENTRRALLGKVS